MNNFSKIFQIKLDNDEFHDKLSFAKGGYENESEFSSSWK